MASVDGEGELGSTAFAGEWIRTTDFLRVGCDAFDVVSDGFGDAHDTVDEGRAVSFEVSDVISPMFGEGEGDKVGLPRGRLFNVAS